MDLGVDLCYLAACHMIHPGKWHMTLKCRVALGITPQSPHGSGRAEFPHPALQTMDFTEIGTPSFTHLAIRWSPVMMIPEFCVSSIVPSNNALVWPLLPSTGFPGVNSPASSVLRAAPTSEHLFPPCSALSLGSSPVMLFSLLLWLQCIRTIGSGFLVNRPPGRYFLQRDVRTSQVPGESFLYVPCS